MQFTLNGDYWENDGFEKENKIQRNHNLDEFSEKLFEIMKKYNINTQPSIRTAFDKFANISDEKIKEYSDTFSLVCYKNNAKKKMQVKREFLKEFLNRITKETYYEGKFIYSENDIKTIMSETKIKIENKHSGTELNKRVKEKLQYSPDEVIEEEKIVLNDEEMEKLKYYARTEENLPFEELCNKAINVYVSGDYRLMGAPERIKKAVLCSLPRYNSSKDKEAYDSFGFGKSPVSRWMYIQDYDDFAKSFNIGDTYKFDNLKSCSKCNSYCENEFRDNNIDMNVKFVIHPKSETSNARSIGLRKYGDKEVIYLPNQEFTVLDKALVKFHDKENDFYRWEIHLQEK